MHVEDPARSQSAALRRISPSLAPILALVVACQAEGRPLTVRGEPAPAPPKAAAKETTSKCQPVPFVESLPIPEASGAVWLELEGVLTLLVVADSGNDGEYVLVDAKTGAVREKGHLPLGAPGDDLEGLAVRGDKLWGLTSSGWLRAWVRRGHGFELVAGPTAIGPLGHHGAQKHAMSCEPTRVNCGRNFEGLCLERAPRDQDSGACIGMAASKADGKLYCVVERGEGLEIDGSRHLDLTGGHKLGDCAIEGDVLWVGSNMLELNQVRRVVGWRTPETAKVEELGTLGAGSGEVIVALGADVFRLSDLQNAPSLASKFRCAPATE